MSPRIALLLLVFGSPATLSKSFQDLTNIHRRLARSHLAILNARLHLYLAGRYQIKDSDTLPIVGVTKNRQEQRPMTEMPNYLFKVCTKCPKHTLGS